MKVKKHALLSIFLCVVMLVSFAAGCGSQEETPQIPVTIEEEPKEESVLPKTDGSRIVVDQLGREVQIPGDVEKIVSTYYISSSLLIALGAKDKVVGIEMKAEEREIYKRAAKEFLELPQVGSGKGINIEEIAKLAPDLVILPKKLADSVDPLEELQIPVIVIDPETLEDFETSVTLIATAVGEEERGKELLQYYDTTIEEIQNKTKNLADKPAVYLSSGADYLRTCTAKMYQNDVIQIAGGNNVSKELTDGYWQAVSPEQLVLWNPDYFLMVSYAEYTKDSILQDERLAEVNAVKNGKVLTFPSVLEAWDYPTPSSVLGGLWLTYTLHPELVSKEEYLEEAKGFYQTFYGMEVNEADLGL